MRTAALARAGDPMGSYLGAERMNRSGATQTHRTRILVGLMRHASNAPITGGELAAAIGMEFVPLMRRMAQLVAEKLVEEHKKGRACRVKGVLSNTYAPVRTQHQAEILAALDEGPLVLTQENRAWVRFTYPAVHGGREVEGVELHFEAGKVVKAAAKKNEAYLLQMLDTDEGSRYLGEFAIGTNFGIQKFTKNILFDEKIGGIFHMALGMGYPDTGSHNQSAIHWDLICDMRDGGEIWVDGDLLYSGGQFVI